MYHILKYTLNVNVSCILFARDVRIKYFTITNLLFNYFYLTGDEIHRICFLLPTSLVSLMKLK